MALPDPAMHSQRSSTPALSSPRSTSSFHSTPKIPKTKMAVYKLESDTIFLRCSDKVRIDIYELAAATAAASSSVIKTTDWKYLTTVGPDLEYDSVEIFGVEISGLAFNNLAAELCNFRLIVNREGYCYFNIGAIVDPSFGVNYYRLNDLFCWSKYGIKQEITSIWNRGDIISGGEPLINFETQYRTLKIFELELELSKEEIASLKIELESCQNGNSRVLAPPPRQPLPPPPPIRFHVLSSPLPCQFNVSWILRKFNVVDEDVTGLFPRTVSVYVSDGGFDGENWRFMRGEENNRTYMVGFYGGELGQVEFYENVVNVPYNRGVTLLSDVYFFVALIAGIGFRYKDKYNRP
ncbi:hypothetical protein JCGZ_09652 [Jatropha curcas]|uniref:Uncharacterized protein n=1 Tax=Jatropha curcas TaxID=180498 RepID=A0A067LDT5_JATCU|nr:uncharacterized protein LOC105642074 [Jatropha curcas]KDP45403.1 hypothetical protein JCGZ_09652 [Jatropha curcas]